MKELCPFICLKVQIKCIFLLFLHQTCKLYCLWQQIRDNSKVVRLVSHLKQFCLFVYLVFLLLHSARGRHKCLDEYPSCCIYHLHQTTLPSMWLNDIVCGLTEFSVFIVIYIYFRYHSAKAATREQERFSNIKIPSVTPSNRICKFQIVCSVILRSSFLFCFLHLFTVYMYCFDYFVYFINSIKYSHFVKNRAESFDHLVVRPWTTNDVQ